MKTMATGGGATNYSCCSSCLDDGRNVVARHYCVDCDIYLCTKCLKPHSKFPATRKHQVNEVNSSASFDTDDTISTPSLQSDVPSENVHRLRCTLHPDKVIDTYCKDHDEVCCKQCSKVKHRLCTTVSTAIAAKDFKTSPERNTYTEALNETTAKFNEEKDKRSTHLERIGKKKLELIENVDNYEAKAITRIKEMANNSRKEIRSLYEEYKTTLDIDIDSLDAGIATHTEYTETLGQKDEEQQFIYLKMNNKNVTNDAEMLLQTMTIDYKELDIRFHFDQTLDDYIHEMKSFCSPEEYKATFKRNVNIQQSDPKASTFVYGACLLNTGELLVTDDDNKKLKRFDKDLQFKDDLTLPGKPVAVCKMSSHEVAVRIDGAKAVHIVSFGQSMQITSSFDLAASGYGMTYDARTGELFACENYHVSVYSKTGNHLRTYYKDMNGEQIFSWCRQISLGLNNHDIYITDMTKVLIILDRRGIIKTKVALTGVSTAWPLCLLPGGICLAGCRDSGVIVQVDKDGKQIGNLVDTKDGRYCTYCAVYDHEQSRLIVGGSRGMISVYTLSAK